MLKSKQLISLIFLLIICCINSELKCNFREFQDTSTIYTCELVSSIANVEGSHMPSKSDEDVQFIKFDGFNTGELFDSKFEFCEKYKNLEILKLFSAGIAELNQNILFECNNLKFLSLASNKIQQIPRNLFIQNSKLTILSLEQNELTTLSENVFANLKELSDLNLSKNKIEILPSNIFFQLNNLRVLKLNSNKIQSITNNNWFRNLRKLENLDLSNNLISNLGDKNFQFLSNLLSLQLSSNNINELHPNVFHNLIKLQDLNLDFNKISTPSEQAFQNLKNLKRLSFGANGIEDLPENIFNTLENLEELKLWKNQLLTIHSDSFGNNQKLILIDLEDNNIDAIDPHLIYNLNAFRLYMDGNNCYDEELENTIEMINELSQCFENYESRSTSGELSFLEVTSIKINTITTTMPYSKITTEAMTTERMSTTETTPTKSWKTKRTTEHTTTRRVRTTTTTEEMTSTAALPFPYPTFPRRPTTESSKIYHTTTQKPLWNLLEPQNIPTCGQSKLKLGTDISSFQIRHGAFPWTAVLIRKDGQLFCGGILISSRLVVTAAHCIEGKKRMYVFNVKDFFIMLGAHNVKQSYEKGRTTVNVKAIHIHHDWNPYIDQYDADIAMIELEAKIQFNRFIQPICIPEAGSIPATKSHGFVVGFGKSEFADIQDVARLVQTPIHNNRECYSSDDTYQLLLSHRGFCGGYANGTGVCTGDSGSGLIVVHEGVFYLRGIVSASLNGPLNGCNLKAYTVFTDILEFTGWIKIGKDDKTLIKYLLDRIRKCEAQQSSTEGIKVAKQLEGRNVDSWRFIFPDD